MSLPRYLPESIGPPETPMVGRSTLAAPISSAGVVLSQPIEQHHAVERIAADRFLDVHAGEVAVQHRGRAAAASRRATSPGIRAGSRRPRARRRCTCSASSRKCVLHGVSSRPGVADADDRAAVELVVRHAAVLDPAAVDEAVDVLAAEPGCAARRGLAVRPFLGLHALSRWRGRRRCRTPRRWRTSSRREASQHTSAAISSTSTKRPIGIFDSM